MVTSQKQKPAPFSSLFLRRTSHLHRRSSLFSVSLSISPRSLNDNLLTGEIPDAFQSLTQLINLDLSNNNLSGELPPSLENLSALTSLNLQNNNLSGTLDVLQDLPLKDLYFS